MEVYVGVSVSGDVSVCVGVGADLGVVVFLKNKKKGTNHAKCSTYCIGINQMSDLAPSRVASPPLVKPPFI
jgi:hypothetical protein